MTVRCCDAEFGGQPCPECARANLIAWVCMWLFSFAGGALVVWLYGLR